jgi:hypothetical protein
MLPHLLSLPEVSDLLRDGFNESVARELYAQGEEVVIWVMLQLAVLAQQKAGQSCEVSLSTPSGSHRPPPEKITRQESHRLACCPDCRRCKKFKCSSRRQNRLACQRQNVLDVVFH